MLRAREWLGLAAFVALCLGISALGALATMGSVDTWYGTLAKPSFNPPDWVFAPVWTVLYLAIAVAGWRVWLVRGIAGAPLPMMAYAVQLGLNLSWSLLLFGAHRIGAALADIVLLLGAIAVNVACFWRIDRWAGALLAPYAAWVAFAATLNWALWRLN